jgi:uncharacterized protein
MVQSLMKKATLLLLVLTAMTSKAFGQQNREQPPPVIVVTGSAQVEADPDGATVRLGVVRQESTAQGAQEQANRTVQAVLAEIAKVGIPAQRIQTSRLTLTPVYASPRPDSKEAPRISAYSASNTVSIEVDNLTQIGPVIDAGLRAGSNQLEGVHFRLKNDLPVREKALKQAVMEARQKAETMAEALGVRLGAVLEAAEAGLSIVPKGQGGFVSLARAEATQTPVSPGQLEVSANVTVRYLIGPR